VYLFYLEKRQHFAAFFLFLKKLKFNSIFSHLFDKIEYHLNKQKKLALSNFQL